MDLVHPMISASFRQSLWIRNAEDETIVLCVEPWGNELSMTIGQDYLVVLEGPEGNFPAVEWSKKRITVYGWSGSIASVFLNGQVVLLCEQKVPMMP
jgi:hypothetical protein